jgi:hypothetical protein
MFTLGGGKESNAQFIPYLLQMGMHVARSDVQSR